MNRPQEALLYLLRAGRENRYQVNHSPNSNREMDNLVPISLSSLTPGDWALVMREAGRHGLMPFLYRKLRPQPSAEPAPSIILPDPTGFRSISIPESVLAELRRAYFHTVAINLQRFHYLGIALRALAEARVPVIVLKGCYLAEAVYGNIGLRGMSDIDILVRRENIPAAVEALRSAGYSPNAYHLEPPGDLQEFQFVHQKSGIALDLHWEIFRPIYPFGFTPKAVWTAAVPAKIAGEDVLALPPEDLLCHLATHAAIHLYSFGLRVLVDAVETIDRLPVNWNIFVDRARLLRSVRPAWLMLALSRRLLGAVVPEAVLAGLYPAGDGEAFLEPARDRIFLKIKDCSSRNPGNPSLLLFFGRRGIRAKLRLVLRKAFPTRASISALYPVSSNSPRVFFYYPRWIWKLVKRNGSAIRARVSLRRKKKTKEAGRKDDAALMGWLIHGEE